MANQLPPDIEEGEILEQDLDLVSNVESGNIEHDNPEHYVQYVEPHAKNKSNSHTFIGRQINSSSSNHAAADVRGYFRGRREIMNKWEEFERSRETSVDQLKNYTYDLFTVDATNDCTYSRVHSRNNGKRIQKQVYPVAVDGVAENIMCQIDEVMCRQNRPSAGRRKKRRAVRELKYQLEKPHGDRRCSSYGPSFEEMDLIVKPGGGGVASRKRRDRCRHCSRGSSPENSLSEDSSRPKSSGRKKRRRMKREEHSDELGVENGKSARFKSLRDFDEVRRDLLEKLKRKEGEKEEAMQKGGEYNDAALVATTPRKRMESSEVIMLESEGDEEMDVARLRLIALASKDSNGGKSSRKGKVSLTDHSMVVVTQDARSEEKGSEEADFDRNELLLRAEALKTALLKKHQKRLNNMKKGSGGPMTDITVRNSFSSSPPTPPSPRSDELKLTKHIADVATETGGDAGETVSRVNGNENDVVNNDEDDEDDDGCKENVGSYCSEETTTSHSLNATSKRFTDHGGIGNAVLRLRRKRIRSKAVMPSKERNEENVGEAVANPMSLCNSKPANEYRSDRKSAKSLGFKNNFSNSKAQNSVEDPSALVKSTNDLVAAHSKSAGPSADNKAENENNALLSKSLASAAVPKPDIPYQRIIVHLGSEDSSDDEEAPVIGPASAAVDDDDDDDDDTIATKKERRSSFGSPGGFNPGSIAPATEDALKVREEKIMSLLGRTRLEIDRSLQKAKKMKPIASAEAICKHLPPSQRLEYLRLKQKIAEREYLMKKSTKSSGLPAPGGKAMSAGVGRGPESGSRTRTEVRGTQVPGPRVVGPSEPPPSARLLPDQTLISKLKFLLKKMKIEKMIEENYTKEIGRLKSQLTVLEKRKAEQELKIRRLAEESLKTYKIIRGEGPPADGVLQRLDVASSQITAGGNANVATAKKQEEQSCPGASRSTAMTSEHPAAKEKSVGQPVPYNSPLEAFSRGSVAAVRLDPNAIMCQFDFTGVCRDEECAYQHVRST